MTSPAPTAAGDVGCPRIVIGMAKIKLELGQPYSYSCCLLILYKYLLYYTNTCSTDTIPRAALSLLPAPLPPTFPLAVEPLTHRFLFNAAVPSLRCSWGSDNSLSRDCRLQWQLDQTSRTSGIRFGRQAHIMATAHSITDQIVDGAMVPISNKSVEAPLLSGWLGSHTGHILGRVQEQDRKSIDAHADYAGYLG